MKELVALTAGLAFLFSFGAYIYVRIYMKPKEDNDPYETGYEEYHPDYARYLKWSRMTLAAASISALTLFIVVYLF